MLKQPRSGQDSLSWRQLLKRVAIGAAIIVSFFGVLFLANAWYLLVRTNPEPKRLFNLNEPNAAPPPASGESAQEPPSASSQEDFTFFKSLTETKGTGVPVSQQTTSGQSLPPASTAVNQPEAAQPKPEPPAGAPKPQISRYAVQVGSFKSLASAEQIQERLKKEGFSTSVTQVTLPDGSVWYRVRMGAPLARAEAEALASELKKEGNLNPVLVPADQAH